MNNFNLHIKPCSVHWNSLDSIEKEKTCAFCSKNVIDFTHHSKNEILEILNNNTNVCGKVKSTQLNSIDSDFINPFSKKTSFWKKGAVFILAFLGFKGFGDKLFAQKPNNIQEDNKEFSSIKTEKLVFKGKISNQSEKSIKISLIIENQLLGIIDSDSSGNFRFEFSTDTTYSKNLKLIFSGQSIYEEKLFNIDSLNKPIFIKLNHNLPTRSINNLVSPVGGVISGDMSCEPLNIVGGRVENTTIFINGIKMIESANLPKSAINIDEHLKGIPAKDNIDVGRMKNKTRDF